MGDLETPCLQPEWYKDCPGCTMERKKMEGKGSGIRDLCSVAVLLLSAVLPICCLFPFIYFMVEDFQIAKTEKDIGYYAGYLGSSFMLGRFVAAAAWGKVADKYGRIPVFILATVSTVILNTLFGFSINFWMAITSRFLLGCVNGIIVPIRAYILEICNDEHQALGLSMVGTFWGIGLIIGPALGGFLSQPSKKFPNVFPKGSLFDRFQYLLPFVCISIFAMFALVLTFWLPETLHRHPQKTKIVKFESLHCDSYEDSLEQVENQNPMISEEDKMGPSHGNKKSLFQNKGLMAAITLFSLWGLHEVTYTEIFSLWAVSPIKYGGLGFKTSDVGSILSITGVMLLFQLFLYPLLSKFISPILMARGSAVLSIPVVAVYPLISKLHGTALWVAIASASSTKILLSDTFITTSCLLINNSVPINQRGIANGVSISTMSLFKVIGPSLAGAVFSWSEKNVDATFLPGTWMVFTFINASCLLTIIATFEPLLPRSLNNPMYTM